MFRTSGGRLYVGFTWLVFALCLFTLAFGVAAQDDAIRKTFHWTYADRTWSLTLDFPRSVYEYQQSLTRTLDYTRYHAYASHPGDDAVLREVVARIEQMGAGLDTWERLNLVIAFVQSIPYVSESCEYPRFPLEMLVDGQGDCEDAAILAAALLRHMSYEVVLLAFLEERHMALGVRVFPPGQNDLQSYTWKGDEYYYLEPTSLGWAIGQKPPAYVSQPAIIAFAPLVADSSP